MEYAHTNKTMKKRVVTEQQDEWKKNFHSIFNLSEGIKHFGAFQVKDAKKKKVPLSFTMSVCPHATTEKQPNRFS
jgi:hypothetical protein